MLARLCLDDAQLLALNRLALLFKERDSEAADFYGESALIDDGTPMATRPPVSMATASSTGSCFRSTEERASAPRKDGL